MKTTHKEKLYLNEHDKKQLGAMIRWLRLQAGWTQQQLVDQDVYKRQLSTVSI